MSRLPRGGGQSESVLAHFLWMGNEKLASPAIEMCFIAVKIVTVSPVSVFWFALTAVTNSTEHVACKQ